MILNIIKDARELRTSMLGDKNPSKRPEVRYKMGLARRGSKNPNWKNGKSFEPYSPTFDLELKAKVKLRDGFRCRLCGAARTLTIHHIDYDKSNDVLANLVTLCHHCNPKMNYNREYWRSYWENWVKNEGWKLPPPNDGSKSMELKFLEVAPNCKTEYEISRKLNINRFYVKQLISKTGMDVSIWQRYHLQEKRCPICGNFFKPNSREQKTCSLKCGYELISSHANLDVKCAECGKVFTHKRCFVHSEPKKNFCSRRCVAKYYGRIKREVTMRVRSPPK